MTPATVNEALSYYQRKDYLRAVALLLGLGPKRRDVPGIEVLLASCYAELGQIDMAMQALNRELQAFPDSTAALQLRQNLLAILTQTKFSQVNEEVFILSYFGDYVGTCLDIGAFTGWDISNTCPLILRGWSAVMIEPSPSVFPHLSKRYLHNPSVTCLSIAIGPHDGEATLYDNADATATLYYDQTLLWDPERYPNMKFIPTKVPMLTFATFFSRYPNLYDFISIDTEGADYEILTQIDFDAIGTKLVCIETNGIETQKYIDYFKRFNMRVIHEIGLNLLCGR